VGVVLLGDELGSDLPDDRVRDAVHDDDGRRAAAAEDDAAVGEFVNAVAHRPVLSRVVGMEHDLVRAIELDQKHLPGARIEDRIG
jgi:hypothetical protein